MYELDTDRCQSMMVESGRNKEESHGEKEGQSQQPAKIDIRYICLDLVWVGGGDWLKGDGDRDSMKQKER